MEHWPSTKRADQSICSTVKPREVKKKKKKTLTSYLRASNLIKSLIFLLATEHLCDLAHTPGPASLCVMLCRMQPQKCSHNVAYDSGIQVHIGRILEACYLSTLARLVQLS